MQKAAEAEVAALAAGDRGASGRAPPEGRARRHDAAAGRAGRAGSADRRSTGAGRRTRLQRQPVRSGQAGQAPGGLGVQAVRLRRRDRSRLLAGVADHESRRADQDAAGRVDSGGRAPRVAGHDDADGAAHVEQPRGGAHAGRRRHRVDRVARRAHGRRRPAQRPVAGAWRRRRHADVDDRRVRGVRESGPAAGADVDPARRDGVRRGALRAQAGAAARGQRIHRVPDDDDAGRRRQQRHRMAGAARRLHAAGGRQDRDDQRLSRRVVHRLHAAPGLRRVGRLRPAADDHGGRLRRRAGRAAVGPFHDAGDEGERARLVSRRPKRSRPRRSVR